MAKTQWLKSYVKCNIHNSIEAASIGEKVGKALYKLMYNAVYGKTMKNLRKKIDVRLTKSICRDT